MQMGRLGEDTGSESVGLAVLFPIVALLIFSAVQGGLWYYAHAVAAQAAQAGVDAGRPLGATTTTAAEAARSFTSRAGRGVLTAPEVQAAITVETVRVTVSGTAPRVLPIPGLDVHIEVSAQASKERFTVTSHGFTSSEVDSGGNSSGGGQK